MSALFARHRFELLRRGRVYYRDVWQVGEIFAGRQRGFQAFTADGRELGIFPDERDATNVIFDDLIFRRAAIAAARDLPRRQPGAAV